ncbi:MAG: S8 family serine peptidase [candidate division WOR-3 bacterium]|nr:S8 family serine peptidase [candidate division WOR-3 bacterium]
MLIIFGLIVVLVPPQIQGKLTTELNEQIFKAAPDEMVSCIVVMKETYPYEEMEAYPIKERIKTYREIAEKSQAPLVELLSGRNDAIVHQRFWVINGFHLEARPEVILEIAKRPDVGWISHNGEVRIVDVDYVPAISSRATTWGIRKIKADSCWAAGYTGQGIILGETDTGVEYTHPALQGKWTGYWKVARGLPPSSTPYDDHGHGTHCMGTILGGDGPGPFAEDIGVAFNAKFVAAKVLNSGGSGSYAQCAEGLQFMADLKDSVDIKAVSNSWGGPSGADTFFYPITRTYISIGIVPVFANGNSGPNPGTVGVPGNYSNVIGVGATDSLDNIANFSSRGPSPNQPPFNNQSTWLRSDWNLIKPQISAPGVAVRSCVPGGGYASWQGTSMATPHVTGAIGLMCQKNPTLSPYVIYDILLNTADQPSQGAPYPNNNYGWGRLNAWRAVQATPTVNQPYISILSTQITDPPPGGNNNGLIEPGETARMVVNVKNLGGQTGTNTTGTLRSYDNFVTINNGFYNFGTIPPQGTASNSGNPYTFTAHRLTPQGHVAKIGLIIHSDGSHDTLDFDDTVFYSIQIGTPPPPYAIYEDDFEYGSGIDSFLNYWDRTGNWNRATNQSYSPPYSAYSGAVNNNIMTLALRNSVNLTQFNNPQLKFWHKYRFEQGIFLDSAVVQISTNGGASWTRLWRYNWMDGDTIPWREVEMSLSSYISNNVKIRFAVDAYTFFNDYADWWIDNFRILVPTDNEPPYFTNTTRWTDTSFTGPFPVRSTITDASGVDSAYLYYRINSGAWQRLAMVHQGSNVYQATIPTQPLNTLVDYYLWARDRWAVSPNSGCDPVGAPTDGYYSFRVRPVGAVEHKAPSPLKFTFSGSNPVRGNARLMYSVPAPVRVKLVVYDVTGRKVGTLVDSDVKPGQYEFVWNNKDDTGRQLGTGIYFIKFEAGGFNKVEKVILLR